MVLNLNDDENVDYIVSKKIIFNLEDIDIFVNKQIDAFITPQTKLFFVRFDIDVSFLKIDRDH